MDFNALAVTFGAIFLVELPDKTFVAALVLSTRYRPLLVWIGVGLAFLVQTLVAVAAGKLTTYLPEGLIKGVALAIFVIGAVVLARSAPAADAEVREQESEYAARARDVQSGRQSGLQSGLRAVGASFLVLFAAEWGDLSQLLTISMVARFDDHLSVFLGAWCALLTVSGLAILSGRMLLRHMRLSLLHYLGSAVCVVLATVTLVEILIAA